MTLIMRDSVRAADIPLAGTDIVCGYSDGTYADARALASRFPGIPRLLIDVNGYNVKADVRDWETGDKAGNLAGWVREHNAVAGQRNAIIYCNRSTIPEVRALTGAYVLGVDYWLWIATLDGTIFGPSQYPHIVACQNKGSNQTHANYDESIVWPTAPFQWSGYRQVSSPDREVRASVTWNGDAGPTTRQGIIPWSAWTQIQWIE
jgi:hypothetical protein